MLLGAGKYCWPKLVLNREQSSSSFASIKSAIYQEAPKAQERPANGGGKFRGDRKSSICALNIRVWVSINGNAKVSPKNNHIIICHTIRTLLRVVARNKHACGLLTPVIKHLSKKISKETKRCVAMAMPSAFTLAASQNQARILSYLLYFRKYESRESNISASGRRPRKPAAAALAWKPDAHKSAISK